MKNRKLKIVIGLFLPHILWGTYINITTCNFKWVYAIIPYIVSLTSPILWIIGGIMAYTISQNNKKE